jgi:hypothetical protein
MRILTLDDTAYEMNKLPEHVNEDMRFSVLDNSDPKQPDFFFLPMIYVESFSCPAIVLEIAGQEITMPLDWNIAVGDKENSHTVDVVPLTSLGERGFDAFLFNPLHGFKAEFGNIKVINFYNDVKWHFPKIKNNQLLSVPITLGKSPLCAFFVKDISRQCESIDYTELL